MSFEEHNKQAILTPEAIAEIALDPYEYYEGLENDSVNTDRFMAGDFVFFDGVAEHVLDNGYKIIVQQHMLDGKIVYNFTVHQNNKAICIIHEADFNALEMIVYRLKWLKSTDEFFYIAYVVEDYLDADYFYNYDHRIATSLSNVEDEAYNTYKREASPDYLVGDISIQKDTLKNYLIEDVYGVY